MKNNEMNRALVECVPNFSEGRNELTIKNIADSIRSVPNVSLLHVDAGYDANRTVMTIVGDPDAVAEAAFRAMKTAAQLIDMRTQMGEHPRFGATDVCPFIPVSGISMDEVVELTHRLGKRVGEELGIHVYLYEESATAPHRRNLATCRKGEYEGLPLKITLPDWIPDFGPSQFNEQSGAVAMGARRFLVAYNVNLNSQSVELAKKLAAQIRESGAMVQIGENAVHQPGKLRCVKAIGWYMQQYQCAQVSMNLTNIDETPLHVVFAELEGFVHAAGLEITGSELVGLIPKSQLLGVAYHLCNLNRIDEVPELECLVQAAERLQLHVPQPFSPQKQVLEYAMEQSI
jgi:glutamate formiminotransferase / formiminotetrahydrofolate cyclodeaminase